MLWKIWKRRGIAQRLKTKAYQKFLFYSQISRVDLIRGYGPSKIGREELILGKVTRLTEHIWIIAAAFLSIGIRNQLSPYGYGVE